MVIIDYLQLMTSGKRVESRQQEVSEFSRSLKLIAKELQVPVIASLATEPWSRAAHRQEARDQRPARVRLDRAGRRHGHPAAPRLGLRQGRASSGEADLIVAKHRNGPTATITVAFQGALLRRFMDMAPGRRLQLISRPGVRALSRGLGTPQALLANLAAVRRRSGGIPDWRDWRVVAMVASDTAWMAHRDSRSVRQDREMSPIGLVELSGVPRRWSITSTSSGNIAESLRGPFQARGVRIRGAAVHCVAAPGRCACGDEAEGVERREGNGIDARTCFGICG